MFRISAPICADREEWRQVTLPMSSFSVEDDARPDNNRGTRTARKWHSSRIERYPDIFPGHFTTPVDQWIQLPFHLTNALLSSIQLLFKQRSFNPSIFYLGESSFIIPAFSRILSITTKTLYKITTTTATTACSCCCWWWRRRRQQDHFALTDVNTWITCNVYLYQNIYKALFAKLHKIFTQLIVRKSHSSVLSTLIQLGIAIHKYRSPEVSYLPTR